jgi:hypothetical protein
MTNLQDRYNLVVDRVTKQYKNIIDKLVREFYLQLAI